MFERWRRKNTNKCGWAGTYIAKGRDLSWRKIKVRQTTRIHAISLDNFTNTYTAYARLVNDTHHRLADEYIIIDIYSWLTILNRLEDEYNGPAIKYIYANRRPSK